MQVLIRNCRQENGSRDISGRITETIQQHGKDLDCYIETIALYDTMFTKEVQPWVIM